MKYDYHDCFQDLIIQSADPVLFDDVNHVYFEIPVIFHLHHQVCAVSKSIAFRFAAVDGSVHVLGGSGYVRI